MRTDQFTVVLMLFITVTMATGRWLLTVLLLAMMILIVSSTQPGM